MRSDLEPCKDCKERQLGCHAECERHKNAVAIKRQISDKEKAYKSAESDYIAVRTWH